ncbi:MAG TPA: hydrolase TatD [Clostridiales bacterium]|jgi:TatD DNase family protein|nr:hydrolase TatD [Clostridiales bacterium]
MLIDSHAHLYDKRFDVDREKIIDYMERDGLEMILHPGADVTSSVKAVNNAQKHKNIYAAVGVHPHNAKDMDEDSIEILRSLASKDKVIGIGEIGLDYHYDNSPRDIQKKWFVEQIRLAKELNLPFIVHDREAHGDILEIIKEEKYEGMKGIIHCYSGSYEMAEEFIKLGFLISIAGPVTFKNARRVKEVVKKIPLQHLLIETDSPYLAPEPKRGRRNEPAYVRYVASEIAEIKDITFNEVAEATSENFKKLFNL